MPAKLPKPFLVLAPMDDVTDTVFRQIVANCAPADLYITEFVNVDGLQSPGRQKLLPKLKFTNQERPIFAQLWGKIPENYYQVAKQVKAMGFDGVDINMGCPDRAVIKNGCCVALINNRELAGEIIQAVRQAVGPRFPISVKTRLGLQQVDFGWHEFLLNQTLNMLSIHGRTASQMSKVPADWSAIEHIRQLRDDLSPTTLIIGNGDVRNRQHGLELIKQYKLDGAMIGRGIFDDPFAFAVDSSWQSMTPRQKLDLYKKHVELFAKTWQPNERKLHTLNKFCKIYVNGFDGAKELREQLMAAKTTDELLTLLK
ncbi:MAG: tRNA dihydrouridine synthase [Candidatus Saccharimonadales bacterium]